ncbi:ribonuclease R [Fibrobacter sp. UWH9]|uniref:ribonuclease R family protein n=1 Tax=unclassified Fibrobacter TaxID=2634177 RepID=UPI00091C912F|nr:MULTISPECIES: RNB domain-containing ribonuclease [unclassified Fibrobacter]MCQ2101296.1 RNB domain-containing ribonuclease [Fibrobacter sp.]OWV05516.1 3'-5' exonuclease [Fibrobacter sp. UWH3]OWV08519.1 3'-5' exonuclease [Fibrobacter sp. UWH1]SHH74743.1 ribonuclease R [Fibrobacter sp. UWH9]SHK72435.1 ribonuclease R [Fibrobacter sp. UWH5]
MAQQLPTVEQIVAVLREEPMVGSRLRASLGLPKKQKMEFKQLLADLVSQGVLKRTNHKEYQIGDGEPLEEKREKRLKKLAEASDGDNRRPGARSRRQTTDDKSTRVRRGVLHQTGEESWIVTELDSEQQFEMCHRRQAPGKEGEVISFTLYPHPRLKHSYLAKVDHSAEILNVSWSEITQKFMEESNLPKGFSKEIQDYIKTIKAPTAKDFKGRVDYRKTTILCIDPEGAMDHDDAISIERTEDGGYKLGVHIADVSYYVPEGSALDQEAMERSYTQYLPWTAVPMIPDELSSDICSLHEDVDRCAHTCMIMLDKNANVLSWDFHRSIVRITRSLTYQQAKKLWEEGDKDMQDLAEVTAKLKANRTKEGLLEFKSTELGCHFNEAGEPTDIYPRTTDISNSWVEECMLIANNCCAKELKKRGLQGIYRIHEAPDTKDIMELYYMYPNLFQGAPVMLRDLGKPRSGDTNLNPTAFKLYEHLVQKAGDDETLMNRILRSMQKAHYDSNSFGHFALNWQDYSHFTSPIRRYADLWCHRELARKGKEISAERKESVIDVCDLISANEIKNMKVERQAIKVCSTWLLKDRIGDNFEATVNGIEEWGIYLSINDPIAEGLCRYRDIAGDDFYVYNPDQGLAFGKRSGRTFRRGDKVMAQLLRVDPLRGQVDFSIIEKLSPEPKKQRRTRRDVEEDARNYNERMDRAEAAEAMGYLSQPDDDDRDDGMPAFLSAGMRGRGRRGRRGSDMDAPSFERTGRAARGRADRGHSSAAKETRATPRSRSEKPRKGKVRTRRR